MLSLTSVLWKNYDLFYGGNHNIYFYSHPKMCLFVLLVSLINHVFVWGFVACAINK